MKFIPIWFCFLLPMVSFSQATDSLINSKWSNFNRKKSRYEDSPRYREERKNITKEGDTLVQALTRSSETNEVLIEESYLHNKKNGLQIFYWPNGVIKEIDYYLVDRLWETISRTDSSGRLMDPGTLHKGTGTKLFNDIYGIDPNCYETYKNGFPEGPFYTFIGVNETVKGNLTYKPSSIVYLPAKRVVYVDSQGDSTTAAFGLSAYKSIFEYPGSDLKVISVSNDSIPQGAKSFQYIETGFGDDPAVIPTGNWQTIDLKTSKIKASIDHDDNGNVIKLVWFDEQGKVLSERKFTPCNKQKIAKYDANGRYIGEFCEEPMRTSM
jgi:antitoxin component YwqK of YwqJK toxin-antitoxin module